MTPANFEACLAFVWGPGRDGARDDRAPGETFATICGVTEATWAHAVEQGIVSGTLVSATTADLSGVLHALYWNVLHCSSLPPGVALMVFNGAMLTGTGRTARMLQRIIGADVDGVVGPQTIGLAGRYGTGALIDAIVAADLTYLASLRNAPQFLRGWTRREEDARRLAYQMAGLAG